MIGFLFAIVAGISMSLQGVFNTRASEKLGLWQTNLLVQGIAFVLVLIIIFTFKATNFSGIKTVNKLYLTGGLLAVVITYTVMESINKVGVTSAISAILIAQLVSSALIDFFGAFDTPPMTLNFSKLMGLIFMITGIIFFKWKT